MKLVNNRIIHRFIKDRSEYEPGGSLFDQIIPVGVQAYSYELKENGNPENPNDYIVRYVLGTGSSTYIEIANGYGKDEDGNFMPELSKEYLVTSLVQIEEIIKEATEVAIESKITHLNSLTIDYIKDHPNEIVQYIGDTTEEYIEGYFYKAIYNTENPDESYWQRVSIQPETDLTPVWEALEQLDESKVNKTNDQYKIYGTDENGNQTTYDKEDFGKVDDVRLYNISTGEYETVVENKIALLAPEAVNIAYTNDQYPAMQTLQDAMDKLLYITPSVSLSGGGSYERGVSLNSVSLSWIWNKKIISQNLNQGIGSLDPTLRSYTYIPSTPITSGMTFTISGSDGTTSKSASTTISFYIKKYYGASDLEDLTDTQIRELTNATSTRTLASTTFNFGTGKYWYYCIPKETDSGAALVFSIGPAGSEALQSGNYFIYEKNDFKNAQGVTIPLRIYKFKKTPEGNPDKLTGTLNVKVS